MNNNNLPKKRALSNDMSFCPMADHIDIMIGYWHRKLVCPYVCPSLRDTSVTLRIAAFIRHFAVCCSISFGTKHSEKRTYDNSAGRRRLHIQICEQRIASVLP